MRRRTSDGARTTSNPATRAEPSVGGSNVVSIFTSVLLPAPFGPINPKIVPGSTTSVRWSTATMRPNRRVRRRVSSESVLASFSSNGDTPSRSRAPRPYGRCRSRSLPAGSCRVEHRPHAHCERRREPQCAGRVDLSQASAEGRADAEMNTINAPPDLTRARERMVAAQLAGRGIADARVLEAMRQVPREAFVTAGFEEFAYEDGPLPIEEGQTISQPYIV